MEMFGRVRGKAEKGEKGMRIFAVVGGLTGAIAKYHTTRSDKLWFPDHDHYERANSVKVTLEALDIGELRKIKLGHDGEGSGSDWYVDSVEVLVPKAGRKYFLPADRWVCEVGGDTACGALTPC